MSNRWVKQRCRKYIIWRVLMNENVYEEACSEWRFRSYQRWYDESFTEHRCNCTRLREHAWMLLHCLPVSTCVCLCSLMRVCWCKCVHRPASSSTVTQSPEPLTDTWHWARTQTCRFCVSTPHTRTRTHFLLHPLCCTTPTQSESQRNSTLGGLETSGYRAIFSRASQTHQA